MFLKSKNQIDNFLKELKHTDVTIEKIVNESKGLLDKAIRSSLRIIGKEKDVFGHLEIPKP